MNILLTGGAGFIGSHTCVELLNAGHDAVIVDHLYNSSEKVIARVEELTGKHVKFYRADACDRAAMDRVFSENQIDAVIHFAAYKAVGESVAKPLEYYRNNLDCTLTVCEADVYKRQIPCSACLGKADGRMGRSSADARHGQLAAGDHTDCGCAGAHSESIKNKKQGSYPFIDDLWK